MKQRFSNLAMASCLLVAVNVHASPLVTYEAGSAVASIDSSATAIRLQAPMLRGKPT
jgi:hypothetical protein